MSGQRAPKRAVTPPKGRPTRSRRARANTGAFGPTAQWVAFVFLLVVLIVVLFVVTGGGDFNPFNDTGT